MKIVHLSILIGSIVGVAIAVVVIDVYFQRPPHATPILQTDTLQQKDNHTCTSRQTQGYDPGGTGGFMCPIFFFDTYVIVDNYSGFDDVCFDKRYRAGNYLLKPGNTGLFAYTVYPNLPLSYAIMLPHINMTNTATFTHYKPLKGGGSDFTYTGTVEGVSVSFDPRYEVLWPWSSSHVTASISATKDAKAGSHWLILAPGPCNGGPGFILTIENSSGGG